MPGGFCDLGQEAPQIYNVIPLQQGNWPSFWVLEALSCFGKCPAPRSGQPWRFRFPHTLTGSLFCTPHLFAVTRPQGSVSDQTSRLSYSRGDPSLSCEFISSYSHIWTPGIPLPESCDADGRPSAQLSHARYPCTPSSPLRRCVLPARLAGVVLVGLSGTFLVVTVNSSRGGGGEGVDWWNAHLPRCTRH